VSLGERSVAAAPSQIAPLNFGVRARRPQAERVIFGCSPEDRPPVINVIFSSHHLEFGWKDLRNLDRERAMHLKLNLPGHATDLPGERTGGTIGTEPSHEHRIVARIGTEICGIDRRNGCITYVRNRAITTTVHCRSLARTQRRPLNGGH